MQFTITMQTDDAAEMALITRDLANLLSSRTGDAVRETAKQSATVSPAKTAPAAKPAKAKLAPAPEVVEDDGDEFGLDDGDEEIDGADVDADFDGDVDGEEEPEEEVAPVKRKQGRPPKAAAEPAPAAAATTAIDLDKHIVPAFKAFHTAHGRDAAKKLLARFKVASVRELSPAHFAKMLATMKKYDPTKKAA